MSPQFVVDTPDRLAVEFARRFAEAARDDLAARGRFACALCGGSVADAFLPGLAAAVRSWDGVEFFWCDERAVPPQHPESNYGLARRLLLDAIGTDARQLHPMTGADPGENSGSTAAMFEQELIRMLGEPPALDLAVVGFGPDGHICSLFPGHPLLAEERHYVAAVLDSPKAPRERFTLTLPTLRAARRIWFAGFGAAKSEVLRDALLDPDSGLPLARALRSAREATMFIDPPAAGLLPQAVCKNG